MRSFFPLAATLLASQLASAQCPRETLGTGMEVERCPGHAILRVDLAADDVGLRVTRPSERGQTVEGWASAVPGLTAAVQAGDFAFPSYTPLGLTVGAGEPWSETTDDGGRAILGFDGRGVGIYAPENQVVPPEPWMDSVVSGVRLVRDGVARTDCQDNGCERLPRTGVGITADGRFLVAVVARAATDPEVAELLRAAGASHALRTGEGATSVLWAEGEFVVPSSDGAARPTAAFLGVVDRGTGAQTRLRGVIGDAADSDTFLPAAAITISTLDGREVATGTPRTEGGYWEFTLPVRQYVVRASHAGFRTGCKICPGVAAMDVWCSVFLSAGSGEERCEPPPRTLEVGPWPEARDAGPVDAGMRDGGSRTVGSGGCGVARGPATPWAVALGLFVALRRRR